MCDEKWVDYHNFHRAGQWVEAGKPVGTEFKPKKIVMIVWWMVGGVLQIGYLPKGQMINATVYYSQIDHDH